MTEIAAVPLTQSLPFQRRLTNPAAAFVENHIIQDTSPGLSYVSELNQFLDEPSSEEQKARTQAVWDEVKEEKDKLYQEMESAQRKLASKYPSMEKVDLRSCTWPQVMRQLERAQNIYKEEKIKGSHGKIRHCLRKLGENADYFKRWVKLLPSGDYGSSICGAFVLVLDAASRMHNVRMCVYDALTGISEAINDARRYVSIYNDFERPYELIQGTAGLYKAVLVALQNVARFYSESSRKKFPGVVFFQQDYEEKLVKSIDAIKETAKKVEREASICSQERQRMRDEKSKEGTHFLNKLYHLLLSSQIMKQPGAGTDDAGHHISNRSTNQDNATTNKGMKPSSLLKLLEYNDSTATQDQSYCRKQGYLMSNSQKDRFSFIANSKHIRSWLVDSKSRALLINGNGDATVSTSPLSYLCAEISQLSQKIDFTLSISYFCGLHIDSQRNPRTGVCEMMISLVGQIMVSKRRLDLFLAESMVTKLKNGSIGSLCKLFRKLVKQLPANMVLFCFIDNISAYETSRLKEDTLRVVECLTKLVDDRKQGVVFKLLVTAPGKSRHLQEQLEKDEIFYVPEHIDGGRQGVVNLEVVRAGMEESTS